MPNIQQKTLNQQAILFDAEFFHQPSAELFEPGYWQAKQAIIGQAVGRGTTYFIKEKGIELVLRHYRRGGLIGKILSRSYFYTGLSRTRAWQEFALLQHLQSLNLPAPTPVAANVKYQGLVYQADLICARIPNAQDLFQRLRQYKLEKQLWQTIGQTIAQFHNHQIYHHDLNIHNIMLDNQDQTWLIDFDKCKVKRGHHWKQQNILRLKRSFEKELGLHNIHWDQQDWLSLISAYKAASHHQAKKEIE
ncbi:3-deoxy-D-manno-octulosonic acid kinase [Paraglaciecola aestuariivivens]